MLSLIIGIQEEIAKLQGQNILERLLFDKTTKTNILWATDAYDELGEDFDRDKEIQIHLITGKNGKVIQYRAYKETEKQSERTRQHAEVFTPLWICKKMNDHADDVWFGKQNMFFDIEGNPTERILFPETKRKIPEWQRYVDAKKMEITCGEAPYLVSRYDVASGEPVEIKHRVGILDRKLRVVNENTETEEEWMKWTIRAFQSVYGYEFQGDNVLIARINLLMTFEEYLEERWKRRPTPKEYEEITNIIAWNIWQMDGLLGTIPYCKAEKEYIEVSLFGEAEKVEEIKEQPPCRIYDWRGDRSLRYLDVNTGGRNMKFDFVIGNPPYQEETEGTSDKPVYNDFMDGAELVADRVCLITPARFLFNAGKTPKIWNEKKLTDPHFKVLYYEQNSTNVFSNTDIKGGVAISYFDRNQFFEPIITFTAFPELNSILHKAINSKTFENITSIIYLQNKFDLEALYKDYPEYENVIGSNGKEKRLTTSIFTQLPVFANDKNGENDISILGLISNVRTYKYINRRYLDDHENLDFYKVILPKANGTGAIGEVLSTPLVGEPLVGYTQSFIAFGAFSNRQDAENCMKYIKTKFARALLGTLKITQDNNRDTWVNVPLQDFTANSDIDWSKSISEIDRQLYAKYGLDEKEIEFIESHVKEME